MKSLKSEKTLNSIKPTTEGDVVIEEKESVFSSIDGKEPDSQIEI